MPTNYSEDVNVYIVYKKSWFEITYETVKKIEGGYEVTATQKHRIKKIHADKRTLDKIEIIER